MTDLQTGIVAAAALLTALAVIARHFRLGQAARRLLRLAELSELQASFLQDWNGDPPRPGYDGRLSFPERMTRVEERSAALNHDMRGEISSRLALLEAALQSVDERTQQLQRNGGSSVADKVHEAVRVVGEIAQAVDRLEVTSQQNREGINQLGRRVTAVDEKAAALGERQEVLRSADQQFMRELQHYIETQYRDVLMANEGLRASLNEALSIDQEEGP